MCHIDTHRQTTWKQYTPPQSILHGFTGARYLQFTQSIKCQSEDHGFKWICIDFPSRHTASKWHLSIHTQELEIWSLYHLNSLKTKSSQCHFVMALWAFGFEAIGPIEWCKGRTSSNCDPYSIIWTSYTCWIGSKEINNSTPIMLNLWQRKMHFLYLFDIFLPMSML